MSSQLNSAIDTTVLEAAAQTLSEVRKAKTEAKRSLRVMAERVLVTAPRERLDLIELVRSDLMEAGHISSLELVEQHDASPEVQVTLAPDE